MMYWNGEGHMAGWGWGLMTTSMFVFWALLIGVAFVAYRAWISPARVPVAADPPRSAEQILAERFARGEIDETEYQSRLAALRDTDILAEQTTERH